MKLIGTKKVTANASGSYGSGNYLWPVNGGALTAYFSDWRSNHYHNALDIAAAYGTEIYATDSGQVIYAGWSGGGHGYNVWIDHGNGITSRYSHCSGARRNRPDGRTGPAHLPDRRDRLGVRQPCSLCHRGERRAHRPAAINQLALFM